MCNCLSSLLVSRSWIGEFRKSGRGEIKGFPLISPLQFSKLLNLRSDHRSLFFGIVQCTAKNYANTHCWNELFLSFVVCIAEQQQRWWWYFRIYLLKVKSMSNSWLWNYNRITFTAVRFSQQERESIWLFNFDYGTLHNKNFSEKRAMTWHFY